MGVHRAVLVLYETRFRDYGKLTARDVLHYYWLRWLTRRALRRRGSTR